MRIRTITAPRMDEALKIIRDQLGPEALILGTRKVKQANGEMGLEITAALNDPEPASIAVAPALPALPGKTSTKPEATQAAPSSLLAHGVSPELVRRLNDAAAGLKNAGFEGLDALEMVLGKLITFKTVADIFTPGHVHALIGPTGAGKTTLAAKLAVQARKQGRTVGLLSLDDQKIGGFEPLEAAATAVGDEAHLIRSAADLKAAASTLGPRHFILIDTPGISAYNPTAIARLKEKLNGLGIPVTTHLVMPGHLAATEMELLPHAAQGLNPTSLLFTKLDEMAHFGALTSVAAHSRLPVGVATHNPALGVAPLTLTPRYLAEVLHADPALPWTREGSRERTRTE